MVNKEVKEAIHDALQVISIIIAAILLLHLIASCSTDKRIAERESIHLDGVRTVSGNSSIDFRTDWVSLDTTWFRRIGHFVIYDTSVTDPDGSHPIAAEADVTTESSSNQSSSGASSANGDTELSTSSTTNVEQHHDSSTSESHENKTVSVMALFAIILLEILLLVAILVVGKKTRQSNGNNN